MTRRNRQARYAPIGRSEREVYAAGTDEPDMPRGLPPCHQERTLLIALDLGGRSQANEFLGKQKPKRRIGLQNAEGIWRRTNHHSEARSFLAACYACNAGRDN